MIGYFLYKLGEFITTAFSLRFAYGVGIFCANAQFFLSRRDRNAVMANLRVICPEDTEDEIFKKTRQVFINFGLYLAEFFRYKKIDAKFMNERVAFSGLEHVDAALKKGHGAILLTAHIGNWELGGMGFGHRGYPIVAIALEHENKKINDFFRTRRESMGVENISPGYQIKKCFKALRSNKLVAILGDRDFSKTGYEFDFLSKTKRIPRGPAVLAIHCNAPIIPVFIVRQTDLTINVECHEPIMVDAHSSEQDAIKQYLPLIEEKIRQYPTQWLMFREFSSE